MFSKVVKTWATGKTSGNFQLHPPCWKDGSLVTNESGNIVMPLIFEAVQREIDGVDFMGITAWNLRRRKSKAAG